MSMRPAHVLPHLTVSPVSLHCALVCVQFSGFLNVPETDNYIFYLTSDDGSRLLLDGQVVVDNNGLVSRSAWAESMPSCQLLPCTSLVNDKRVLRAPFLSAECTRHKKYQHPARCWLPSHQVSEPAKSMHATAGLSRSCGQFSSEQASEPHPPTPMCCRVDWWGRTEYEGLVLEWASSFIERQVVPSQYFGPDACPPLPPPSPPPPSPPPPSPPPPPPECRPPALPAVAPSRQVATANQHLREQPPSQIHLIFVAWYLAVWSRPASHPPETAVASFSKHTRACHYLRSSPTSPS